MQKQCAGSSVVSEQVSDDTRPWDIVDGTPDHVVERNGHLWREALDLFLQQAHPDMCRSRVATENGSGSILAQ